MSAPAPADAGTLRLGDIAHRLGIPLQGDPERPIQGLATLAAAGPRDLTFLASDRYRDQLAETRAGAVILRPDRAGESPCDCLLSERPYEDYARVTHWFDRRPSPPAGVHPTALVAASARIDPGAAVGPGCVIGEDVHIGPGTWVGAGSVIGDQCHIGTDTRIYPRVVIYHRVSIGDECVLHSGAVIGADGFGFARGQQGWLAIAQLGGVRIGNRVSVGANTTIDRGAIDDTVVEDGVIIDNQVQIAHNVRIGARTAIAACTGIAGSARIGCDCTLAGGVGVVGHIEIADSVHVTAMSIVTRSIDRPGSWSSGTASMPTAAWRRSAVRFAQLDALHRRVTALERTAPDADRESRESNGGDRGQ